MRFTKHLASLGLGFMLALSLCGCRTYVPNKQLYASSFQNAANATEHWRKMSAQLCNALLTNQVSIWGAPVFIEVTSEAASDFSRAYEKLLRLELLARGCTVMETPDGAAFVVSVDPQMVQHGRRAFIWNSSNIFGGIGYAVMQFFTGSPQNDWGNADYLTSQDLLITTCVRRDSKLVAGAVQIVYVPAGDAELYGCTRKEAADQDGWNDTLQRAISSQTY